MVKVIFYNLLRSKYNVREMMVESGSIRSIIEYILEIHTQISRSDFETCVVFHHGKPIHSRGFEKVINDKEEIIITHFVGGG